MIFLNEDKYTDVYGDADKYFSTERINNGEIIDTKNNLPYKYDLFDTREKRQKQINDNNTFGRVVMMSPNEYYKACADMFDSTVERLKHSRGIVDADKIEALKSVLLDKNKKFPMPYIDVTSKYYSKGQWQEGLHRMYAIGELYGWDKKVPVFSISYYSVKRNNKDLSTYNIKEDTRTLQNAVDNALEYSYSNNNTLDEFKEQVEYEFQRKCDEFAEIVVTPQQRNSVQIKLKNNPKVRVYIDKDDILISESDTYESDDLDDINDLLLDDSFSFDDIFFKG